IAGGMRLNAAAGNPYCLHARWGAKGKRNEQVEHDHGHQISHRVTSRWFVLQHAGNVLVRGAAGLRPESRIKPFGAVSRGFSRAEKYSRILARLSVDSFPRRLLFLIFVSERSSH